MEVRIYNKTNKTYQYRHKLSAMGFYFESNYWKKECDKKEAEHVSWFCAENGLEYVPVEENYSRGKSYRYNFFRTNAGIGGYRKHYHCAYCGRIVKKDKITVDHLVPVNNVLHGKRKKFWRNFLKIQGIDNVNDVKNLVPACKKCNSQKGIKTGIWLIRGMIGRNFKFWCVYTPVKICTIAAMAFALYYYLETNGILKIFM